MRWESLLYKDFGIYQDETLGRFTEDPVRLVHFLHAKQNERMVDVGTGNGIIPIYTNALYGCPCAGLDVDGKQLQLARLSAEKNGQDIPFFELDVSDAPKASAILLEQGFVLTMTPVVAVSVEDKPGGLAGLLKLLPPAGIDVEYMYSIFGQIDGRAHMIFRVADPEKMVAVLESSGYETISAAHLGIQ